MLDDWEENLAMITANRTKDDELVLIHLGDCLWKETSNVSVLRKHTTVDLPTSISNDSVPAFKFVIL